jgi:hypothetical protein
MRATTNPLGNQGIHVEMGQQSVHLQHLLARSRHLLLIPEEGFFIKIFISFGIKRYKETLGVVFNSRHLKLTTLVG